MSDESIAMEVGALAAQANAKIKKMARDIKRVGAKLGWQDNYRRLFCDQETGALKPEAVAVLRDLGKVANFGVFDALATDADLRTNEGARRIYLHIYDRLNMGSDELIELSRKIRENSK